MKKYLYLLYMHNFTSYYEEKTNIWLVIFKDTVWSGFLMPQGLNCNHHQFTFVLEVKKTGPDHKKTENHSFNQFYTGV